MKRIARFEKVTKEQFCEGYRDCFGEDGDAVYETLTLPRRANFTKQPQRSRNGKSD